MWKQFAVIRGVRRAARRLRYKMQYLFTTHTLSGVVVVESKHTHSLSHSHTRLDQYTLSKCMLKQLKPTTTLSLSLSIYLWASARNCNSRYIQCWLTDWLSHCATPTVGTNTHADDQYNNNCHPSVSTTMLASIYLSHIHTRDLFLSLILVYMCCHLSVCAAVTDYVTLLLCVTHPPILSLSLCSLAAPSLGLLLPTTPNYAFSHPFICGSRRPAGGAGPVAHHLALCIGPRPVWMANWPQIDLLSMNRPMIIDGW